MKTWAFLSTDLIKDAQEDCHRWNLIMELLLNKLDYRPDDLLKIEVSIIPKQEVKE